jgi:pimeloyl-ACP methyl ester carboxylesterase
MTSGAMTPVTYSSIDIDGLKIAYREAGMPGRPKMVLLHGFPSSSHQYRDHSVAAAR